MAAYQGVAPGAYRDIIEKSARCVVEAWPRIALKGESEAVHEFRLSVKKLRALLPAIGKGLPVWLDSVFRASGRVRDLDVQRELIREILKRESIADSGLDDFIRARRKKARRRLRALQKTVEFKTVKAAMKALRRCANECKEIESKLEILLHAAMEELRLMSEDLTTAKKIHAFRIQLKSAVYLNKSLAAGKRRPVVLEEAGELLGDWHDLVTSQKTVERFLKKNPGASCKSLPGFLEAQKSRVFESAMQRVRETDHV